LYLIAEGTGSTQLPPEPTSPAVSQFLRHTKRSNTSSLREQKQSKQRANNPSIFNSLQMHYSVSPLDSHSYILSGGVFFPGSATTPRVSAYSASLRYLFPLRLSTVDCQPPRSRHSPLHVPSTHCYIVSHTEGLTSSNSAIPSRPSGLTVWSQSFPSPSPIKKRK